MQNTYVGIDTSNYKTSIAAIDADNNLLFEKSEFLDVKPGELGLRQSTAFFMHSNRMPAYIKELFENVCPDSIQSIGVSTKPRRIEGSYMPCFLAGKNSAETIAAQSNIPLYEFSHQEGHAASIINHEDKRSLLLHLSGGTTEFLMCEEDTLGYKLDIVGGTKDISIGQLLDRVGVYLGYQFPAGKYLDEIASQAEALNIINKIKIDDGYFNLSGIENKVIDLLSKSKNDESNSVIASLFYRLSKLIYESSVQIASKHNLQTIYFAGGVSSSQTIKSYILRFKHEDSHKGKVNQDIKFVFSEPKFCGDNAIGIARLALKSYETSKR